MARRKYPSDTSDARKALGLPRNWGSVKMYRHTVNRTIERLLNKEIDPQDSYAVERLCRFGIELLCAEELEKQSKNGPIEVEDAEPPTHFETVDDDPETVTVEPDSVEVREDRSGKRQQIEKTRLVVVQGAVRKTGTE